MPGVMSQLTLNAYTPLGDPEALDQSWCPECRDLTRTVHLTTRPTNVRRQFNSIIFYFHIFCMDKCMSCMQMSPINLDYKNSQNFNVGVSACSKSVCFPESSFAFKNFSLTAQYRHFYELIFVCLEPRMLPCQQNFEYTNCHLMLV